MRTIAMRTTGREELICLHAMLGGFASGAPVGIRPRRHGALVPERGPERSRLELRARTDGWRAGPGSAAITGVFP